jgi:hypothetical protein
VIVSGSGRRAGVERIDRRECYRPDCLEMFGLARAVALRLARGQIEKNSVLRYPSLELLLMSRIQSGDGTARTDAEDEEHKPFSHGSPSPWLAPFRVLLDAFLPI